MTPRCALILSLFAGLIPSALGHAADWPTWRADSQRSAATPHGLPENLRPAWSRELPRLTPAWPDQPKLQFDAAYEPVAQGQRLFIGSAHDGSVTAFDTRTGEELWRFFSDGPVRFAPLVFQEKLYFVSDDGYLYCLSAANGSLAWKFRGGPSERKVLGNERLISMWPARGAPVLADGTLYFAAGIWPFMGIFLHALDAESGRPIWTNDGDGSLYIKQPHNSDSFAGVAPQGPLVAVGNKLLIPGGRSVPAYYNRETGKLLYYQLAENGKRGGGSTVVAAASLLLNGGSAFDLETEKYLGPTGDLVAFAEGRLYEYAKGKLRAVDLATAGVKTIETIDRKGEKSTVTKWSIDEVGAVNTPRLTALIKAGNRLYAAAERQVLAYSLPLPASKARSHVEPAPLAEPIDPATPAPPTAPPLPAAPLAKPAWSAAVEGTPGALLAADNRLFLVTREGMLHCYASAEESAGPPKEHALSNIRPPADGQAAFTAQALLRSAGVREGYCLIIEPASIGLPLALAKHGQLRIVVLEPNAEAAHKLRTEARLAGWGADRISVVGASPIPDLPPYLASLIIVGSLPENQATESGKPAGSERAARIAQVFNSLRPYGGVAVLPVPSEELDELKASVEHLELSGALWKPAGEWILLVREGPLPGAADWTHEHADAANTRVSKDTLVKAPLGLLWFGGASNESILPRHGHGPQPQVVEGRLFIEGMDSLRALDIYTGRVLWETRLPGVGALYDNTAHQPGANAMGTNYISTPEGIYVALGSSCLKLDPATGKKLAEYRLPLSPGSSERPRWGYLNVTDDYIVGGADPLFNATLHKALKSSKPTASSPGAAAPVTPAPKTNSEGAAKSLTEAATALVDKAFKVENDNYSASKTLVVLDRESGKVVWSAEAQSGFRHNAVCIGGGRVYCIDRLSGAQLARIKRRGEEPEQKPRLVVFDLATGAELWSTEQDVFGTWLSYSHERDILVEAGRNARDTLSDEPRGMRAYRAADGSVIWSNKTFSGPAMIHHDTILMQGSACSLLSGAPRMREHPLSGESVEWVWSRNYGCNTPLASEHLLTFRSGAAGYLDLCNDGGTGNFGGFRSSCTNNLIVAGGVICAPEYTRTCTCAYQNQTSLALVHMPEVETWTFFGSQPAKSPIRRLGLNLGAPGDRKAENGTLWLEYPQVGGPSPPVSIQTKPEKPEWFRRHSSQLAGDDLTWVAASGASGLAELRIRLASEAEEPRKYAVRLVFSEPENLKPGDRRFTVRIQGEEALRGLDIVREAGGPHRVLVKTIDGVLASDELIIELLPDRAAPRPASVLSGIEILAQGW